MIQTLVLSSLLLTLPAQDGGRASSMLGGKAAAKVETAKGSDEALAQYNELKAKAPGPSPTSPSWPCGAMSTG